MDANDRRSGGCAMGSLGEDVDVSNVTYSNVYTWYALRDAHRKLV